MRRALLAGSLVGVAAAVIGTWIVLRGLSFLGDAIAHGALPGIALAFLMGFDLFLGGAISALVMIALIAFASRRSTLGDDASIGLLFVGMLALGIVLISAKGAYAGDLTAILFGDVVGVTVGDVRAAAIGAVLTIGATIVLYRPFLAVAFSEDQAKLLGMRPGLAHLTQLALLSLVIVASFRTVGTLLVFALIVAPPAAASQVARRVPSTMVLAAGLSVVAVYLGLLASFHLDTAGSATIALVAVAEFFVIVLGRDAIRAVRRRGVRTA
ncbi:MAG: ABC-type Mn2+/Zn2+ transport system permease subunit [Nitriliruptoraceae bacterium]|jgi:ABC-type Mn2+/Zn2+ transport system permease subunit